MTKSPARQLAEVVGLAVAVAVVFVLVIRVAPNKNEQPHGCDPFGYARQARLFQENGFFGGLDTRLESDTARLLIDVARSLDQPVELWSQLVAPPCHNYKPATDRIVLQYPPGEGFLLSLFDEGKRNRSLHMVIVAITAAASIITVLLCRNVAVAVLAAGLGVMMSLLYESGTGYLSATPSIALSMAAAWLSVRFLVARTLSGCLLLAATLGAVLGMLTDVRLSNVLLLSGYAAATVALARREPTVRLLACAVLAAATYGVAVSPTLIANLINAGSILSTTYSPLDAKPPSLDPAVVLGNLEYYFGSGRRAVMLWLSVGAAVCLVAVRKRLVPPLGAIVPFAVAANLLVSLAFFLTHEITTRYYLLPAAVWCAWVALFAVAQGTFANPVTDTRRGALAALAVVCIAAVAVAIPLDRRDPDAFDLTIPDGAVVWAHRTAGMFILQHDTYAATPTLTRSSVRDAMIEALDARGVPQVLVADTPSMETFISTLRDAGRVERIGEAFGADVYALKRQGR